MRKLVTISILSIFTFLNVNAQTELLKDSMKRDSIEDVKFKQRYIESKTDVMTGSKKFSWSSDNYNISFSKHIDGKVTSNYLLLRVESSHLSYGGEGVIILFDDGTKWQRTYEKIDVDVGDDWRYSAFLELTKSDIEVFKNKNIVKYRLYIYDGDFKQGTSLKKAITIISKMM